MNFETDPKSDSTSETFSLKPNTKGELVWINSVLFSLIELDYADMCECMNQDGFLLNKRMYLALKTAVKTKALINKLSKHLLKNYNIDGDKEDFAFILEGILGTLRKCYKVAEEPEIVILISLEKIQDLDEDGCCCCDELYDNKERNIDPKTLN